MARNPRSWRPMFIPVRLGVGSGSQRPNEFWCLWPLSWDDQADLQMWRVDQVLLKFEFQMCFSCSSLTEHPLNDGIILSGISCFGMHGSSCRSSARTRGLIGPYLLYQIRSQAQIRHSSLILVDNCLTVTDIRQYEDGCPVGRRNINNNQCWYWPVSNCDTKLSLFLSIDR